MTNEELLKRLENVEDKGNTFINTYLGPIVLALAMGILSLFLFGKLEKIGDTQIKILQNQAVLQATVETQSATQGSFRIDIGTNKLDIREHEIRLESLEK